MKTDDSPMRFKDSILDAIGSTPLVKLNRVAAAVKPIILAKVEYFNPGGSIKDRIGVELIRDAVERGVLRPGGTIVESTSGNTGVGLALAAAVLGYKIVVTMPDKMSTEKIRLLQSYGARVIVCPTDVPPDSPESYYAVARRIAETTPNAVLANQYFNPANPRTHYETTGPEIWRDTAGKIDCCVIGMGTCGTMSGVSRYLKERKPEIRMVGVDPEGSILARYFSEKEQDVSRPYLVEGIGEDMIPGTYEEEFMDEIVTVGDKESFLMARRLAREEGLMVGGSAGTAVVGALRVAERYDREAVIVVILPDTGERYLSRFHSDEWMREHGLL